VSERHAEAYRAVRTRTGDLVRGADRDALEAIAPATPEWRVKDLLAHLVGVTADVAEGRLDGVATEPWTAAQVAARREATVDDLLAEWDERGPGFEATLVVLPEPVASQAVFDAITHEQDIRQALGVPGGRDSDAVAIAFEFCMGAGTQAGGPALRVVHDAGETTRGDGEPVAIITTSRFEYVRAVSGRRTEAEISAFGWNGTPQPELVVFAPLFTMRSTSLQE
jgi:uncharacterized protein (TIGR03083 family)